MNYKVIVSESAAHDLDEIITYISNQLNNKTAAKTLADQIEEKIKILENQPYAFESSRDEDLARNGWRRIVEEFSKVRDF